MSEKSLEESLFFAYGPYADPDYLLRLLGREVEPTPGTVSGYRLVIQGRYHALVEDSSEPPGVVDGILLAVQAADVWLIEAEFGLDRGDYRWREVSVTTVDGEKDARTLIRGPVWGWRFDTQGKAVLGEVTEGT